MKKEDEFGQFNKGEYDRVEVQTTLAGKVNDDTRDETATGVLYGPDNKVISQVNMEAAGEITPKKKKGALDKIRERLNPGDWDFKPNYERVREMDIDGQGKPK